MPNRHAPHSHIAGDPKPHKPCHHCGKRIALQHKRAPHTCSDKCHEHGATHDHSHEAFPAPIVRYFDDAFNEMCEDCAMRPAHTRKKAAV